MKCNKTICHEKLLLLIYLVSLFFLIEYFVILVDPIFESRIVLFILIHIVFSFGHWEQGDWIWDLRLCRTTFDLKVDFWEEFNSTLHKVCLDGSHYDRLFWIPSSSNAFSCKSFIVELIKDVSVVPIWKALWRVHSPVKVKTFMWLLIKGRFPVREKLARLNLLNEQDNLSPLWYMVAWFRRVLIIIHNSISNLFDYWFNSNLPTKNIDVWCLNFFALVWTIWNVRNRVFFHNEPFLGVASLVG